MQAGNGLHYASATIIHEAMKRYKNRRTAIFRKIPFSFNQELRNKIFAVSRKRIENPIIKIPLTLDGAVNNFGNRLSMERRQSTQPNKKFSLEQRIIR